MFDVVLLALCVNLTFTARTWPVSLKALLSAMSLLVVGDVAYAIIGISGRLYASPLLDVPFLLSYTALGVAALHPSVVELGRATRYPVQAWSWGRMLLLVPAVLTPFLLLVFVGGHSAEYRALIGACGIAIVALLLLRAVTAVKAQVAAQLHSEHQAMHDPLTGLPNRRMISTEIARLIAALPPDDPRLVWVCFLDLDGFKWVNDSWGHDTGDQLVIEVGTRLQAVLPAGTMLARVGGDEFLIAYVGGEQGALRLVDDVHRCFARPLPVRDTEVVISASIGIAHAPGNSSPPRPRRRRCCATPTPRCTAPRPRARATRRSSTARCTTGCASASSWRPRCAPPWPRGSSTSSTSRSCGWRAGARSAPRH
nr:hypothetical protein GCM10020092_043310 [Actinoplanes digitatis]